jgi:DNA repair photolyase
MTNFSGQNMNTMCTCGMMCGMNTMCTCGMMCGMCFAMQIYDSDGFSVSP